MAKKIRLIPPSMRPVFARRSGLDVIRGLPSPRQQLVDPVDWVPADHARQDVVEIGVGFDAIQLAGLDERAHRRPTGAAAIAAGEEMILAPKRHRPDGSLDRVRVELDAAVVQESGQPIPARECVPHRLGEFSAARQMREVCFQPDLQSVDDRLGERPSRSQPVRRRLTAHLRFDGIEAGDPAQSLVRQRRILGLHNLIELASCMGPAGGEHDVAPCRQPLEAGIAIDVQHSLEVFQMRRRPLRPPVRREDVDRRGRRRSAPWSLVTRIDPKPPGLRSSAARIEDRDWRVVGEQMIGGEHVLAQAIVQRLEPPARAADPAGEGRALQFDAVAGEDLRLPIEWRVVRSIC